MSGVGASTAHGTATHATTEGDVLGRTARLMTWALVLILVWLPLQTPIAVAVFQYGHSVGLSRATLLLKDAAVALLLLYALGVTWRTLKLRWFDKLAIAYVVLVVVYSIVPWLLGSDHAFTTVASAAREFALPVEAYALGRLAYLVGADVRFIFRAFVVASAVVALIAIVEYFVLPITFWSSTLDLVSFERIVQGVPSAISLWDISLLGDYGAGGGTYPRAIATFAHPVGAAGYFILPLGLTVAAWYGGEARGKRLMTAGLILVSLLFALATIVTLSRGAWLAVAVAVVMCGYIFRRLRMAFLCLTIMGIFLVSVPPFNQSISSALNRNDGSMIGHMEALGRDVQAVMENVFGMGLGSADRVVTNLPPASPTPQIVASPSPTPSGQSGTPAVNNTSDIESAGIGEDLYLSVLVSTGPLGAAAFFAWCLGLIVALVRGARQSTRKWLPIGTAAALVGSLVSASTSSAMMRFTTAASAWLLLGLATSLVLASSPKVAGLTRPRLRGWLPRRPRKASQP